MSHLDNEIGEFSNYIKGSELEGMLLSKELKKEWGLRIEGFAEESLDILANSDIASMDDRIRSLVYGKNATLSSSFIEDTEEVIAIYADMAYEVGLMMYFKATKATATQDLIDSLHLAAQSSKINVARTIKRWFKTTQGEYFERFIIPKLDLLSEEMKALSDEERIITLNKLGRDYKKFVKGDGYWDAVSDLDTATATMIGQVDYFSETKVQWYVINALFDKATCPVCANMSGSRFSVQSALDYKMSVLGAGTPEELADTHPWPRARDLEKYDDLSQSPYVLPPYHPHPVSEDTEILTDTGWVFVRDISTGNRCITMNPNTEIMSYSRVKGTVEDTPHKGEMVHFLSQNSDLLTTGYHQQIHRSSNRQRWKLTNAYDLVGLSSVTIPVSGIWDSNNDLDPNLLKFLAYYISDGSCNQRGDDSYQICIHTKKYQNKAKLVLEKLTGNSVGIQPEYVRVNSTKLGKYILRKIGKLCDGKRIPKELKDASPMSIRIFLNAYLEGDGSRVPTHSPEYGNSENRTLYTTSKILEGELGELILKAGGRPSYHFQEPQEGEIDGRKIYSKKVVYRIRWSSSKTASFRKSRGTSPYIYRGYTGKAYCVELEDQHLIYVRRNGKCCWTGNCRCWLSPEW